MQERLLSSPWDWKQVGAQVHSAAIPVQRPSLFAWCSEYPRIISKTNRVLSDATASLFQDFRVVRNGITRHNEDTLETIPGTHRTNYPRRTTFLPTSLRVGTRVSISALRKEDADFEVTMAQSTKL